jgi:hypothetical protein
MKWSLVRVVLYSCNDLRMTPVGQHQSPPAYTEAEPTEPMQRRNGCNRRARTRKKHFPISRKGLNLFSILAPRPGLEPGTYGLTVEVTPVLIARKVKICNEFSTADAHVFSMPNRRPNLWLAWWWRCLEKSNTINELREISVELAKTERADRA